MSMRVPLRNGIGNCRELRNSGDLAVNMNRRSFLSRFSGLAGVCAVSHALPARASSNRARKKIAFLCSTVYRHSHAQHFLDRLCLGYGWRGAWQNPRVDVASIYIDQFPDEDLGRNRIKRYGLKQYSNIADALTLGTGRLAVDGVVIIAEHGDYPKNEKGQKLYPRYKWFKECVKVFEKSNKSVPIFNDKHLSTSWKECEEMVADSRRLGFAFMAGSSLPVTRRMPSLDIPYGTPMSESVCVAYGGPDVYDIHALETAQCMSERRQGGEVGINSVQAFKGERLWNYLEKPDRRNTRQLMVSALTRSHNLPVKQGYYSDKISFEWARKTFPDALAYFIEHRDGFRTSMFLVNIQDFNYAGMRSDTGEIISCQMYLPMPEHGSTTADFFHPLTRHIENMILTGKSPYPVERTLLTSGMTLAGVESLYRKGELINTPDMNVAYKVGPASTYWRD